MSLFTSTIQLYRDALHATGRSLIRGWLVIIAVIALMIAFAAMITGPVASFLVESFPAKVRYTSMSLPYHFGNGWFGGFLPLIATALVARTGNIYAGLIYPTVIAFMTFVVGSIVLEETRDNKIWDEV